VSGTAVQYTTPSVCASGTMLAVVGNVGFPQGDYGRPSENRALTLT
jgi:hypothetical protein